MSDPDPGLHADDSLRRHDSPRVLHIVYSLGAGGMENGIVNVSRALAARGYDMRVCCLSSGGRFAERLPDPSRVCMLGKPEGFSLATVRKLAAHIREVRPDILHTHNFGPLIYTTLAAPCSRSRILHGEHAELTPGELAPRRLWLRRFLYGRVERVHTVGVGLRDALAALGFHAGKIDLVVNGVDTTLFRPGPRDEARAAAGLPRDGLLVGLVGRFGEFKRHLEIIEAFELLPAGLGARLIFIGAEGPMEQAVRDRAAASPLAAQIIFAGFHRHLAPWYQALDLLAIPSVNEGLSNALLEAMACGIPVLAHTACGSADVIADGANGFLADLAPPGSLAAALAGAISSPTRLASLGATARATIEASYSLASMVDGYERLYREIAIRARRRSD